MKTILYTVVTLGVLFLFYSCKSQDNKTNNTSENKIENSNKSYLLNDIWVLETIEGKKPDISISEKPRLELFIKDKRVGGKAICNTIMGSFDYTETTISFKGIASTRMACPKGNLNEHTFLSKLNQEFSYKIKNLKLYLINNSGKEVFCFRKVD